MEKKRRQLLKSMASTGVAVSTPVVATSPVSAETTNTLRSQSSDKVDCGVTVDSAKLTGPWPMARFDPAGTGYNPEGDGPSSESVRQKWVVDGGPGKFSAPILGERSAFAMAYYPNAKLTALDLETGKSRWNETPQSEERQLAETPPILTGSRVVGGLKGGRLLSRKVGGNADSAGPGEFGGSVTALKSLGSRLVVGTGERTPRIAVTTAGGTVCQEYRFEGPAYEITNLAVANGEIFYATAGDDDGHHDFGSVGVINPESGDSRWEVLTAGPVMGLAVAEGSVFIRTDSHTVALDAETGSRLWQLDTEGGSDATPTVAEGTAYFGGLSTVTAVDVTTGDVEWERELSAKNARPIVVGDRVYFTADKVLDRPAVVGALDRSTGVDVWRETIEERRLSAPAIGSGMLLVAANRRPQGPPGTDSHENGTSEIIAFEQA